MMKRSRFLLSDRLSTRVFCTIWLSMAIMIWLTVLIPRFDQRRILPLSTEEEEIYQERFVNRLVAEEILANQKGFRRGHDRKSRGGRQLITIPNNVEGRYSAIHSLRNDGFTNFIINTINGKRASQQSVGKELIVGPFHVSATPDYHYYIVSHAPPQAYYLSRLFDAPLLLIMLMTIISVPFVIMLTWSLSKPMEYFKKAAERVAEGDWSVDKRLEQGPIEYRTVGRSFNRMVEALTSAENEKNRLFANLSHELRTPLTRIRLTNSLIRRKASDDILPEVKRIEDNLILIEDRIQSMLSLSRELIINRERFDDVSLVELLTPLLEDAKFEAKENHIKLGYNRIPNLKLALNSELFTSGLENILRNAVYYASSEIKVNIYERGKKLILNIHDDGPGVKAADLDHLFEAFYRGERPDGMKDYGGSGLGLSIAKQMALSHKGEISAENDNGLSITLTFPLAELRAKKPRFRDGIPNHTITETPLWVIEPKEKTETDKENDPDQDTGRDIDQDMDQDKAKNP